MFGCDTKIIEFVGCPGEYGGTMRECQNSKCVGAIPGAASSWEIPKTHSFSTYGMSTWYVPGTKLVTGKHPVDFMAQSLKSYLKYTNKYIIRISSCYKSYEGKKSKYLKVVQFFPLTQGGCLPRSPVDA